MERNLLLELLEDGNKVSLYSPHFEGEAFSEFEKFLLAYKDIYPNDVRQLVYRLDIIKREGAEDRHFKDHLYLSGRCSFKQMCSDASENRYPTETERKTKNYYGEWNKTAGHTYLFNRR